MFSNVAQSHLPFLSTMHGKSFLCLRQSEIVQICSACFIHRSFAAVSFLFTNTLSEDAKLISTASANSES